MQLARLRFSWGFLPSRSSNYYLTMGADHLHLIRRLKVFVAAEWQVAVITMQQCSTKTSEGPSLDEAGLCLLSLDGGGVRGLSTLLILKRLMDRTNNVRKELNLHPVKPWELFDLIGGTTTGGYVFKITSSKKMLMHLAWLPLCLVAWRWMSASVSKFIQAYSKQFSNTKNTNTP